MDFEIILLYLILYTEFINNSVFLTYCPNYEYFKTDILYSKGLFCLIRNSFSSVGHIEKATPF